jgi:hypothetical protein
MKRTVTVVGLAALTLLGLGACGKKSEGGGETTSVAIVKQAPSPGSPAAAALTPPPRKAGLWEQKISTAGMNQTMKMCLDESVDQKMKWWGSQAQKSGDSGCEQERVTPHAGGGWDFHAVCKMGESGTVTSDGAATGDFSSHYKVDINSVTTGSPMAQANGAHKTTIEATWMGPCPTGMVAGDMEMPGGMKINMLHAMDATSPGMGGSGRPSAADIARMRAQAKAMAAAAKEQP